MLGKLIKHDFRALSRLLIPTNLAVLGATVLATAGLAFTIRSGYNSFSNSPLLQILESLAMLLIIAMVIAIFAAFFFMAFVVFQHFYKNFMTSEGYLTFTLPAKTSDLLWSKLITAIIWLAISTLAGLVCLFIFLTFGTSSTSFVNADVFRVIGDIFRSIGEVYTGGVTVIIIEILLFILVATVSYVLQVYLALIIGGVVSQKHKLVAGIGFYFVINFAMGIISTIIQFVFFRSWAETLSSVSIRGSHVMGDTAVAREVINAVVSGVQPYYWIVTGLMIVYAVAFYLLSHYLLKNKLNLE